MDNLVGTSLGGYTIIRFLGSGGMGAVYLAEDPAIGQQVATKIVRTDSGDSPDMAATMKAVERFKQEARAVASLDHLHILPLYRYGEEQTSNGLRAYMVMQYRPEGSLSDWLGRRVSQVSGNSSTSSPCMLSHISGTWPLSLQEAGEYLRQAASALQYAHDRGIIHRDIKPANFLIRLDTGNTVHLLLSDFGLAKFYSAVSATSHILGTPTYMAPEQFEGAAAPESDQYALAIMLYYFLAGRLPFEGDPMQLMHQHISVQPAPIRKFAPSLPEGIEDVLSRALAKKPTNRYPSIAAFAEDFAQKAHETVRSFAPQFPLPTFKQDNQAVAAQATPVLPVSNADGVTAANISRIQPPPFTQGSSLVLPKAPTVAQPIPAVGARATTSDAAFTPTIYPNPATPGPLAPAPPLEPVAPSSRVQQKVSRRSALGWILGGAAAMAVGSGTGIYFFIRNQKPAQALYVLRGHSDTVTSLSWSPGSSQLVSGSRDSTARTWSVSNEQNTITYSGHQAPVLTVAWSPTGNLLASGGEDQSVKVWDTTGTLQHSFSNLGTIISALAWNLRGDRLFVGTLGSGGRELLVSTGEVRGKTLRGKVHALALSPHGNYLAAGLDSGFIVIENLLEPISQPLTFPAYTGSVRALAWSVDGSMLAAGGTNTSAQILDATTGQLLRTLPHSTAVYGVAWDPINTSRLATASLDGTVNIWNTNSSRRIVYRGHEGAATSAAWSASGLASGSADKNIIVWKV